MSTAHPTHRTKLRQAPPQPEPDISVVTSVATEVHLSAVVSPHAKIGRGCLIGPYSVIGDEVVLGDGVRIESHCVIDGRTIVGEETHIFPFVSIGLPSQDLKYKGEAGGDAHRARQSDSRIRHNSPRHQRRRHAHRDRRQLLDYGAGTCRARLYHRQQCNYG
ncbi:MAG: hypothetical protein WKF84_02030 [Pyrinomonadaceae bacterium]